MKKFKCACNEEFDSFSDYAKHAKNCVIYQTKQNREARLKIENGVNISG